MKTQTTFMVNPEVKQLDVIFGDIVKARDEFIGNIHKTKVEFMEKQFRKVIPDYDWLNGYLQEQINSGVSEEELKKLPLVKKYSIISQQLSGIGHERFYLAHRRGRNANRPIKGTEVLESKFVDNGYTFTIYTN